MVTKNKSGNVSRTHLKETLTQKIIEHIQGNSSVGSILSAISKISTDINMPYVKLKLLLFSMYGCDTNGQFKEKIKELIPHAKSKDSHVVTNKLQINKVVDKAKIKKKIIRYLDKTKSIIKAIHKTSQTAGLSYDDVTRLLYSMFKCNTHRQLKKKIKLLTKSSYLVSNSVAFGRFSSLKRKRLKKILMFFKKGYSARDIIKKLGISYTGFKGILKNAQQKGLVADSNISALKRLYFNKKVVYKIVKYLKDGYGDEQIIKKFRSHPSHLTKYIKRARIIIRRETKDNKTKNKIQDVRKLYLELGTLRKVANKMGITRERVRQLLKRGEEYNLFEHESYGQIKLKELVSKCSRDNLMRAIKTSVWSEKICSQLGMEKADFEKLLKYYKIDYTEYRRAASMGRYITRYSQIVDTLGHHPSTTEMSRKSEWRSTWAGISRLWGNLDSFRKEYGIEKPKRTWPHKFQERLHKLKKLREERTQNILNLIKTNGMLSRAELALALNMNTANLYNGYLYPMSKSGVVKLVGNRSNAKYVLPGA